MEHTPGPWMAKGQDGRYLPSDWSAECEDAASSQMAPIFAGDEVVALVVHASMESWGFNDPKLDANSRLIAAAPDLLTAVVRLLKHFPTDFDMTEAGWEPEHIEAACKAHDIARAVVAKATGKAA